MQSSHIFHGFVREGVGLEDNSHSTIFRQLNNIERRSRRKPVELIGQQFRNELVCICGYRSSGDLSAACRGPERVRAHYPFCLLDLSEGRDLIDNQDIRRATWRGPAPSISQEAHPG